MTQEIIEGNKLIALSEFASDNTKLTIAHYADSGNEIGLNDYISNLNYHESWDWLMPVWGKAQEWYSHQFGLMTSEFDMSLLGISIKATSSGAFKFCMMFHRAKLDINIVWMAMVEFCKWHNSLTPSSGR